MADDRPILHLDGFDGAMDLLLDLAERQRIDLGRLSVRDLAEQFAAELQTRLAHLPVERRADWIVLASRLLLLHSALLLPHAGAAAAAGAAELDRIEALLVVRAAGAWLEARPQLGRDVFARPARAPARAPARTDPRATSYMALLEACLALLRGGPAPAHPAEPPYRPPAPPVFRIADAIARLQARLRADPAGGPLEAFLPPVAAAAPLREAACRQAVASTLVASLELARSGAARLRQDAVFGPLDVSGAAPPLG